jgi:hypothetical protein
MDAKLLQEIESTKDLELLGFFCWWGIHDAHIPHNYLEQWFKEHNLNPDLLISAPTYESTFTKACNKVNRQKINDEIYLVRPVLKDANRCVVAVVKESEVNEDLQHRQEFKIVLDRNSGALTLLGNSQGQAVDEVYLAIASNYESNKNAHDSYDICRQILALINSAKSLHVREKGGIYFTLFESKSTLDKIEALVNDLNLGHFYALPQLNITKVREAVSQAFLNNTISDIAGFQKSVDEWDSKNPHAKSLEAKIEEINVTKEKIKSYARVLKLDASAFDNSIQTVELSIKKLSQRKLKIE